MMMTIMKDEDERRSEDESDMGAPATIRHCAKETMMKKKKTNAPATRPGRLRPPARRKKKKKGNDSDEGKRRRRRSQRVVQHGNDAINYSTPCKRSTRTSWKTTAKTTTRTARLVSPS